MGLQREPHIRPLNRVMGGVPVLLRVVHLGIRLLRWAPLVLSRPARSLRLLRLLARRLWDEALKSAAKSIMVRH